MKSKFERTHQMQCRHNRARPWQEEFTPSNHDLRARRIQVDELRRVRQNTRRRKPWYEFVSEIVFVIFHIATMVTILTQGSIPHKKQNEDIMFATSSAVDFWSKENRPIICSALLLLCLVLLSVACEHVLNYGLQNSQVACLWRFIALLKPTWTL